MCSKFSKSQMKAEQVLFQNFPLSKLPFNRNILSRPKTFFLFSRSKLILFLGLFSFYLFFFFAITSLFVILSSPTLNTHAHLPFASSILNYTPFFLFLALVLLRFVLLFLKCPPRLSFLFAGGSSYF